MAFIFVCYSAGDRSLALQLCGAAPRLRSGNKMHESARWRPRQNRGKFVGIFFTSQEVVAQRGGETSKAKVKTCWGLNLQLSRENFSAKMQNKSKTVKCQVGSIFLSVSVTKKTRVNPIKKAKIEIFIFCQSHLSEVQIHLQRLVGKHFGL